VGPDARASWNKLEEKKEYEHMNAVLRSLIAAVKIDASSKRGRSFDYGRVDIEANQF
jgi:site-specific DNA recombinase